MSIPSVNLFSNRPGGGVVTAMGGMNALANDMILRQINEIKKQYAPTTAYSEAASKLAYANLMAPQFMAKLMGNDSALANMTEDQKKNALNKVYQAANGGSNGFSLGTPPPMPLPQGIGHSSTNSLSGWITDKLKGAFGHGQGNGTNPLANPGQQASANPQVANIMARIAHVESGGSQNPYSLVGKNTGKGDHALGKYQVLASNVPEWTQEALGHSMTPQEFLASPESQEKVAQYMVNKHLQAGKSPQDIGSIWFTGKPLAEAGNVKDAYGTTPSQYINKMNEGMNQAAPKTYAENTSEYKSIIEEGKELGKIRAKSIGDLDEQYQQAVQAEVPVQHLIELTQNPAFQNMRNKVPFFQDKQLEALSKIGTPEEQRMIGDFTTTATDAVANTVRSFRGRILDKEISMANQMKITPKDTWDAMIGKLGSIKTFNEMTKQRARFASQLMQQKHLNRGEAMEIADKFVDGNAIRKSVEGELNPKPTDADIAHMAKKYNISEDEVKNRLRAKGLL